MKTGTWIAAAFLTTALTAVLLPEVQAQEGHPDPEPEPVLVGTVVDADTGTPLMGAFVHLQGEHWGVFSDDDGRFRLPNVSYGRLAVTVERLGYRDLRRSVLLEENGEGIVLALQPDPIVLEGLRIVHNRLEYRRRAFPFASQVVDREELMNFPGWDLVDVIERRSFLRPTICPSSYMDQICAVIRGRIQPVRVYVDEMPVMGGLDYLSVIQPHELHRVEVFHSVGQVRAYTEQFMERAGRRPRAVFPLIW